MRAVMRRTSLAGLVAAAALVLGASAAGAAPGRTSVVGPSWSRPVAVAQPSPAERIAPLFAALPDGNVLVRNGRGAIAVDARRGVTRWSIPAVVDAAVDGAAVIVQRPNVVFALRPRNGALLWKRPCANPPYAVPAGGRVVTVCGGVSTVLDERTGRVLARHAVDARMTPPRLHDARALTARYVLVANAFDGAWMGDEYAVVDARSGAFVWSQTDFRVVGVTPTAVSITPYPSMLPWTAAGTVVRRRLSDGAPLATMTYALPDSADNERGDLVFSSAAAYVTSSNRAVYRFRRGDTREPHLLVDAPGDVPVTLGAAAFVAGRAENRWSVVSLDRPSRAGRFETRVLGRFPRGFTGGFTSEVWGDRFAVRVGARVALAAYGFVWLYDEFGKQELAAESPCDGPLQVIANRAMLFTLCMRPALDATPASPARLAAYARP
jgi:PQQ-like domain